MIDSQESTLPPQVENKLLWFEKLNAIDKSEIIKLLLKDHSLVHHRDIGSKRTCVHVLSEKNDHIFLHLLVSKYGADVDAIDILGRTPLHIACMHQNKEIINTLIKNFEFLKPRRFSELEEFFSLFKIDKSIDNNSDLVTFDKKNRLNYSQSQRRSNNSKVLCEPNLNTTFNDMTSHVKFSSSVKLSHKPSKLIKAAFGMLPSSEGKKKTLSTDSITFKDNLLEHIDKLLNNIDETKRNVNLFANLNSKPGDNEEKTSPESAKGENPDQITEQKKKKIKTLANLKNCPPPLPMTKVQEEELEARFRERSIKARNMNSPEIDLNNNNASFSTPKLRNTPTGFRQNRASVRSINISEDIQLLAGMSTNLIRSSMIVQDKFREESLSLSSSTKSLYTQDDDPSQCVSTPYHFYSSNYSTMPTSSSGIDSNSPTSINSRSRSIHSDR